jgi:hypothetical protein
MGHAISYWTWRSLAIDHGLSTGEASALAAQFVLCAAQRDLPARASPLT